AAASCAEGVRASCACHLGERRLKPSHALTDDLAVLRLALDADGVAASLKGGNKRCARTGKRIQHNLSGTSNEFDKLCQETNWFFCRMLSGLHLSRMPFIGEYVRSAAIFDTSLWHRREHDYFVARPQLRRSTRANPQLVPNHARCSGQLSQ